MASIVVISALPTLSIVVMQDRAGAPSTCTVQAPQSAMPQPNLVPVMPKTSRRTQRRGVSPSTSAVWSVPLTLILKAMRRLPDVLSSELRSPSFKFSLVLDVRKRSP